MLLSTRTLRRRLAAFAGILAAALALMTAAAAVPARADGDDLAKALAAVAIIGLIAKSIEDDDRDDRRGDDRWRDDRRGDDRRRDDRRYRDVLPAHCAVDTRSRRGGVVYAERCLRNAGVSGRFPYYCSRDVRVRGRYVTVFPQRCLVDAGYRPERRR